MTTPRRAGFSLMEVMLATGILLGCAIVLSELAGIGHHHAVSAEDMATAQWICQNKLNEILSGVTTLDPVDSTPLEDDPGWMYSVDVQPIGQIGLVAVRVIVWQDSTTGHSPQLFSLVRWMRDPGYAGPEAPTDPSGSDATPMLGRGDASP